MSIPKVAIAPVRLLALRTFGALAAFSVSLLISRWLGAQRAGAVFSTIGVVALASGLARLGIDTEVSRRVALELNRSDGSAGALSLTAIVVVAGSSALIGALIALLATAGPPQPLSSGLMIGVLAIPPLAVLGICSAILVGASRAQNALVLQSILPPTALVSGVFLLRGSLDEHITIWVYVVTVWLSAGIALAVSRRVGANANPIGIDWSEARSLISVSPSLFLLGMGKLWYEWGGPAFLGISGLQRDAALFSAAARITGVLAFLVVAVEMYISPRIAVLLINDGDADERSRLFQQCRLMTVAIGLPACVVVILFSPAILGLFGSDFVEGATALRILCAAQLANAFTGPAVAVVLMARGYSFLMRVMVQSVAISAASATALVTVDGASVVAVAFAVGIVYFNIRAFREARRVLSAGLS